MNDQEPINYNRPVAYDVNGRPLYAHPPQAIEQPTTPTPIEAIPAHPQPQAKPTSLIAVSKDDASSRHAASRAQYPALNLSEGEYVIEEIRRHPAGLVPIIGTAALVILAGLLLLVGYPSIEASASAGTVPSFDTIVLPISLVMLLAGLVAYAASTIYNSNRFYLTNESVIEETQTSLFAHKERTVGLHSIEEVTFRRNNLFQNLFGYGTVDLTIEGHTIYHFPYVGNPKERVDLIVNTVEKVKAGHHG